MLKKLDSIIKDKTASLEWKILEIVGMFNNLHRDKLEQDIKVDFLTNLDNENKKRIEYLQNKIIQQEYEIIKNLPFKITEN